MSIFVHYYHVLPFKKKEKEAEEQKRLQDTILVMHAVIRNKDIIWSGLTGRVMTNDMRARVLSPDLAVLKTFCNR